MGFVKNILALITCGLSVLGSVAVETNYGACQTPNRTPGDCVVLQSCTVLYTLALKPNLKNDELIFLKRSKCGTIGKNPLVCCPKPTNIPQNPPSVKTSDETCETPNGIKGKCISISKCNTLLPLARNDRSKSENNFLTRSMCGKDSTQICCPDPQESDRGKLPLPPNCGHVPLTKRIFDQNLIDIGEFPWTALIIYSKGNGNTGLHCGGSLINERYVLTAAHCISERILPSSWHVTGVRLGEWNQETERDCQIDSRGNSLCADPHIDIDVEEQICSPLYNVRTQENDIALLRLREKVIFNDFLKPICLPVDRNLQLDNFENATMDIVGWGATETSNSSKIKLKALVKGQNLNMCKYKYHTYANIELGDTQMCAVGEKGEDTCRVVSGGPLMFPQRYNALESYFLVGVFSFGPNPCGQEGFPDVYTRVGYFLNWIQNTIRK
ncbi:serine protease easter-like [Anastrepha obliqua]|uniref:serine protease easter-like n=1 Tax=Anastrepha obliqua TaxID=95512 RepID=UPI0024093A02|nr:serine protease easter-like [Anastrepha obliqua]